MVAQKPSGRRTPGRQVPEPRAQDLPASVEELRSALDGVSEELGRQYAELEAIRSHNAAGPLARIADRLGSRQLHIGETLEELVDTDKSLARFSGAELSLLLWPYNSLEVQLNDVHLRSELRDLIESGNTETMLVGLPAVLRDAYWSRVWLDMWPALEKVMPVGAIYANSHVSRPIAFEQYGRTAVRSWQEIFAKKRVCFIAPASSQFTFPTNLIERAMAVKRLPCEIRQAYDRIDEIEAAAVDLEADVYAIELGPSAPPLAARLARRGLRALDVGALGAGYDFVEHGAPRPDSLRLS